MRARVLSVSPENLQLCGDALKRGELVAMPTETVYGLAGNAFDPEALARIFDTKERPNFDPLIIHLGHIGPFGRRIADLERLGLVDAQAFAPSARARADALLERLWPGPFTVVLPKTEKVPDLATSGLSTVALRMPRHPVAQALIATAGVPLAAPSANRFGRISPTRAEHVVAELGDRISWVLDGGACEVGVESTIVSISDSGEVTLLRPGGTPLETIQSIAGVQVKIADASAKPQAPGMLESHYAPMKPLRLLPKNFRKMNGDELRALKGSQSQVGLLLLSPFQGTQGFSEVRVLSEDGDLREAARGLFSAMRELDSSEVEMILAEPCEAQSGLGYAIADRLRRASSG